jgi:FkbM family methyltransferase
MNQETEFLGEFMTRALDGPRRLAIDVGSNAGEWSRWMALHFSEVLSFEPDHRCMAAFRRQGVPPNCCLIPMAVGPAWSRQILYVRNHQQQSSLEREHPIGGGDQRAVETVEVRPVGVLSLEQAADIIPELPVDFVKIDVEGSEADVLAGITSDRFRNTRFLIEVHDRIPQVAEQLVRLGYDKVRWIENPHPSAHPNHVWVFLEPLE